MSIWSSVTDKLSSGWPQMGILLLWDQMSVMMIHKHCKKEFTTLMFLTGEIWFFLHGWFGYISPQAALLNKASSIFDAFLCHSLSEICAITCTDHIKHGVALNLNVLSLARFAKADFSLMSGSVSEPDDNHSSFKLTIGFSRLMTSSVTWHCWETMSKQSVLSPPPQEDTRRGIGEREGENADVWCSLFAHWLLHVTSTASHKKNILVLFTSKDTRPYFSFSSVMLDLIWP